MPYATPLLAGQETLLSCWRALARTRFGPGQVVATGQAVAAVFPRSAYFNNAILTGPLDSAAATAASMAHMYAAAGATSWSLWIPSEEHRFGAPADRIDSVGSLARDVTTLVMLLTLRGHHRRDPRVRRVSGAALQRLALDEVVSADELGAAAPNAPITGWALIEDGRAVGSAFTHRHGEDVGIYAVGTLPPWRRRGVAGALTEHILADAHRAGIRTASLQSTPMGESVYDALGFRAVGRYEEWVHTVQTSAKAG